jgi:hypothetical protein
MRRGSRGRMTGDRPDQARGPRLVPRRAPVQRVTRLVLRSAAALVVATAATVAIVIATTAPALSQRVMARKAQSPEKASPTCTVPAHIAKGQIVVAVVADFGGENGKVIVTCVLVKPGVSGAQVLQAQAALLGYPSPRYAESGLLCAIDGYPTSGCGTETGAHYAYWAYWHGGKRWLYANGGPGESRVVKGDVEGWRFEPDGSATPSDPPPRAASSAAALEVPARAAASATTTSSPSGGDAAGPVSGERRATTAVPFVISVVFILIIGAAAMLRSRRANRRGN